MCSDYDANDDEVKETEISFDKVYRFPDEIVVQKHGKSYLVIFTEGISWLVLKDENMLSAFEMLRDGKTIAEALDCCGEDAVSDVVTQIEAKQFDRPRVVERQEVNMYALLTNRCNQRCRHCYMYAGDREYAEMTTPQWMRVLGEFRCYGGSGVTFSGGEVTVYDGYSDLIKYAHEIGLSVTVLSNGILWTQETIDDLHDSIDEIQVSVDGYDAASYKKVRRYDGFDKAIDCIRRFNCAGTRVSMAVTPLLDELDSFADGFEGFAKGFLARYPEVPIKLNLELIEGREVSLTPEQNRFYRKKLRSLAERLYPNYYTETFVLNHEDRALRRNCGFGELSVAPNGDVYWCNRIPELTSSANVLIDGFESIMQLSSAVKRSTSVDNTIGCDSCDIRYICGGGCRLEYDGITEAATHTGRWSFVCPGKDDIYDKMILCNEYFFE